MAGHPRFRELVEQEVKLHEAKNYDYAAGGDPLGNFKRVAAILDLYPHLSPANPSVLGMVYMLKQLDAVLWRLSQGYESKIEGFDEKLRDIAVYAKLVQILLGE